MPFKNKGIFPLIYLTIFALIVLSFFRICLIIYVQEPSVFDNLGYVLLQGLRVDLATVCPLFGVITLILLLCQFLKEHIINILFLIKILSALSIGFLVLNEISSFAFIDEYGVRPNLIYVEYLKYPKEVFSTILKGHILAFCLSIIITLGFIIFSYKFSSYLFNNYQRIKRISTLAFSFIFVITLCPLAVRSTLGHRPLNPAMIAFSPSVLANNMPLNSTYSAIYAYTHQDVKLTTSAIYALASVEQAQQALDIMASTRVKDLSDEQCIFNAYVDTKQSQYKNVVIVIEESFGANFIGHLGGLPLSPNYDKLVSQGHEFTNMYATGHRSIRGLEAISAGYPPSPLQSIVKSQKAQNNLATLMNIYKSLGYNTSFVYGGESHFDNMRNYFLANGMNTVIEQKDYTNPQFVASWGVSDEDLFTKANSMYKESYAKQEKFFSIVFTSSFHDPFEIPNNKVSLPKGLDESQKARFLGVMYADYALGQFFKQAMSEDYYKDTIFLVIADHESQVKGNNSPFPLFDFKIPALILGSDIKPFKDTRLVSQIDMAPTLLSLSGVSGSFPFVGRNLLHDTKENIVAMQFNNIFALRKNSDVIVLAPQSKPIFLTANDKDETLSIGTENKELEQLAVGILNLGPLIYTNDYNQFKCIKLNKQAN